ncbi:Plant disease resistance response protein [Macleaya cordata]|uniref:Dirigent protein n=1 Tax=Macleaya cordata TaxID=56857 RepID=A0A200R6E5_MACCD|nr:Plant disease resistance response protein [Macleaya cordata]
MKTYKPITTLKAVTYLVLLALTITCVSSARILDEEQASPPTFATEPSDPVETPVTDGPPVVTPPVDDPAGTPVADVPPMATPPIAGPVETPVTDVPPVATPPIAVPTVTSSATVVADPHHPLSFFMQDILGGSNPSARAVTGIVTNPAVNGQVPFSKPNGAVLPVNNGVPLNNGNNGIINNNNLPFLTGLSGTANTVIQNNGNNLINGGFGLPSANGAQLPVQKLMFGTMTVIDDELTEGHELGSGLVGKAQGFYVVSSEDGSSQTMAFTAMFNSGNYIDTLSFFGVHRTAVSESQLAIMGGTGKYVNAKGFATIKTIPSANQHSTTDGAETLLQFTVYLA